MELLDLVVKALDDVKAQDIVVLDMRGYSPLFDYMVIASSSNTRQSLALVRNVTDELKKNDYNVRGVEGSEGDWVLVDCKDIIVNVFTQENRTFYGLENLYLDIPRVDISSLLK